MPTVRIADLDKPVQSPTLLEAISQLQDVDIKFDQDTIINLAREQLDVPVNIDDGFFERFSSFAEEAMSNAPTHKVGQHVLQSLAVNGIREISRMNYLHQTYPEVSQTPIKAPLVMAGMPRSGTTFLLQLMSTAPLMTVKRWEVTKSFPSKAVLDGKDTDRRHEEAVEIDQFMKACLPKYRAVHNISADDSTEEVELMLHGLYGVLPSFFGDTPNFDNAFYANDHTEGYEFLYKYLQALRWVKGAKPDEKWFMKSPQHLGALPALRNVFPDAAVVFTHRDPASIFISLVTLLGYLVRQVYSSISKEQLLGRALRMQHGFMRGIVKNADIFEESTHIYFHELKKDHNECVERIFTIANMPYDAQAQAKVADQAALFKRGGNQGRVEYDLEGDFGMTRDQVREEFSYYFDRFPVQIEEAN